MKFRVEQKLWLVKMCSWPSVHQLF